MEEQRNNDLIRYTLQSFIGKTIGDADINNRQQEAIQRLCQLKNDRFYDLCNDIINEIHRRSGMNYDKNNKMTDKFSRLSDEKFENLVIDTLSAFYLKHPECKMEEMPEFLDNLKLLIENLKSDLEKTSFMNKLDKLDLYNKLYVFLDLAKRKGIDESIIQCIQASLDSKVSNESVNFLEILAFPNVFLGKLSESQVFKDSPELLQLMIDIEAALNDRSRDVIERSTLIKENLIQIMSILITNSKIPARKIECFKNEIDQMVSVLYMVKNELEGNEKVDFGKIYSILMSSIDEIYEKTKEDSSESALTDLEMLKISLESLTQSIDKPSSIRLVIDAVKDIRKHIGMTGL